MFAAARCETDWEEKQVCRWDHELTSCVGVAHPFGKQQVGLVTSVGLVTPDIYISPPPHKNMMRQTSVGSLDLGILGSSLRVSLKSPLESF